MAKSSQKIIEVFQLIVDKDEKINLSFEEIVLSDTIKQYEAFVNGKDVSVSILEENSDVIIGIVETLRRDNIPPKKDKNKKKVSALGLANTEGLVYGNVFLYEKKRKILMYEVNKFGSYVNHFLKCLQDCCDSDKRWNIPFKLIVNAILKPDEYIRIKKMNFFKSIEMKFANPKALYKDYVHENDALSKAIKLSKDINSDTFSAKFESKSKKQGGKGLSDITIRDIIEKAKGLLNTKVGSENVQKLVVYGYAVDEEDVERLEPIDLLADRYLKHITLNEPRENSDLLENQRKQKIKELYSKCKADFILLFGK